MNYAAIDNGEIFTQSQFQAVFKEKGINTMLKKDPFDPDGDEPVYRGTSTAGGSSSSGGSSNAFINWL